MKNNSIQIAIAVILTVLLLALGDLFPFWMPTMNEMAILLVITLLLIVWAGFIMKENAHDEREVLHKMHAGRFAYLSGIGVLTVALVSQGIAHTIDPWITVALIVMVITKIGARIYSEKYK